MKVIETADAPRHTGPVPQAVESAGWIFVSALFGNDPQTFNEAWVRHFGDHRPARSAVEVKDFGRAGESVRYMVEAQAYRG